MDDQSADGATSNLRSGRVSARQAFAREIVEIVLPVSLPVWTEREKIVPAVDAGRMHVVEYESHRVIADRIDLENGDVLLARDGLALVRGMALHLRARAFDAQIFGAQVERLAVVEGDGQRLAVLVQPQLRRPGRCVGHFDRLARGRSDVKVDHAGPGR